jgi:hypothetical protein
MTYQGTRLLDVTETHQMRWMMLPVRDCPNQQAEQRVAQQHFLVPHTIWSWPRAFVQPVTIRRTHRRVLLLQQFGVDP